MQPSIGSPGRSGSPGRLLEGFNEIRHAVEVRESRLSMILDTLKMLNESQGGGYPSRGAASSSYAPPSYPPLDSYRPDHSHMMYRSAECSTSPSREFEDYQYDWQQLMLDYEAYRNSVLVDERPQRPLLESFDGTLPDSLRKENATSILEQTIATGSKFGTPALQNESVLEDRAEQLPATVCEETDGDNDANSLDDLLLSFKQTAQEVTTKYQNMMNRGLVDKEMVVRVHRVFQTVRKELTRTEKMASSSTETPRKAYWENMHGMHEKKRPSFNEVLNKVRVECQVAKHWRHETEVHQGGHRARTLTDAELRESIPIDDWDELDVFRIESEGKMSLSNVFMRIWKKKDFNKVSRMSEEAVLSLVMEIEAGYRDTPYHNRMHAADATAASYYFMEAVQTLTSQGDREHEDYYRKIDMMILLFAAAVHDIRHPGVTNDFLVKTRNALAIRYNDASVLENYHAASAFEIMRTRNCDILEHNSTTPPPTALRSRVISLILSTDMTRHKENYEGLAREVAAHANLADIDKLVLEQNVLHCADIGHPMRAWAVHQEWSNRVCQEFFSQGDEEQQLGFEPVALFDRNAAPPLAKGQIGFINFVFMPAWKPMASILGSGSEIMDKCLSENLKAWEQMAAELEEKKDAD